MQIRQIDIEWFRGIRTLHWVLGRQSLICLIGPGDSTKTTILDAIDLALSPRSNVAFSDADFYGCDTDTAISIAVTVGDLPEKLKTEPKFAFDLRGWGKQTNEQTAEPAAVTQIRTEGLNDEPQEGDELVLTVKLTIDKSLEPEWTIVTQRCPEGHPIYPKDRESLGVARLGASGDWQLSWTKRSLLSRLTGDVEEFSSILATAGRKARESAGKEQIGELDRAAKRIEAAAQSIGVTARCGYQARLDVQSLVVGAGAITLHDGNVPVRCCGTGTRRLLTLAAQKELLKSGCITLVDEVEHGLEPHRIHRLLRLLKDATETPASKTLGQTVMTTHSSVVVVELKATDLAVVRSADGQTTVTTLSDDLQDVLRASPEAFLARHIIVGEGRTELGLCRFLDRFWSAQKACPFAAVGVVPIDGRGSNAPRIARGLKELGYDVLLLGDSDQPISPTADELRKLGITVVQWAGDFSIEQRLSLDLPWAGVLQLLDYAAENATAAGVRDQVLKEIATPTALPEKFEEWIDSDTLRRAIGKAAKTKRKENGKEKPGWFKSITAGEDLAAIAMKHFKAMAQIDFPTKISEVRTWVDLHG